MIELLKDIQFVLVLYKEKLENSESFNTISQSIKKLNLIEPVSLFIYDNSPISQKMPENNIWKIEYFHDSKNSGLSKAYNTAAQYAKEHNKKWLFLLDQDTVFPEDTIEKYLKTMSKHLNICIFAPILNVENGNITSPYQYKYRKRKVLKNITPGIHSLKRTGPVNSGLCISLEGFWNVGGYNEKVRVDGADFQFIERFKRFDDKYYVLDIYAFQNLSHFETNTDKLIEIYRIFLRDVKAFEKFEKFDVWANFSLKLKRTLKLTLQTKKISFLRIFIKHFFTDNF